MSRFFMAMMLCVAMFASFWAQAAEEQVETDCVPEGRVLLPASNSWTTSVALVKQLRDKRIVLLGEHHDNIEHHRWQLQMITGLHVLNPNMVLGFEMFPRQSQPVLDRWVAGELTEDEFLKQVKWAEYWSFDPALYLPMFHYARMNKIPMYALNVNRSLIHKVGAEGWDKVPVAEQEGVSKPATASQGYKKMLSSVFMNHGTKHGADAAKTEAEAADPMATILADPGFNRFVESQSVWDRAMAEGIINGRQKNQDAMMVAVMGSGHMMYHFGVPEQLVALGEPKPMALVPWDTEFECSYIDNQFADAVIGLRVLRSSEKQPSERLRLGVYLEKGDRGVLIKKVVPGSLAEKNELKEDDMITEMAGRSTTEVEQVIESVKSMQPGTWLPIKIQRGKNVFIEIVVKFPNK
ncbi:MAG: ChaN family lipoprotein [Pseudomonadota bacterium]|nr:ChaN family lipoprotein [Pseudomonadota bacterium]